MARKSTPKAEAVRLDDENWGERVHRAYRTARTRYGNDFNYRSVAKRIQDNVWGVYDSNLISLEKHAEVPTHAKTRWVAYLALLAYGYEPSDFGLSDADVRSPAMDPTTIRDLLVPSSKCIPLFAA